MMGLETLNRRPEDMNAHLDRPAVALSALPGDDAVHVSAPVVGVVSRLGLLKSLASANPADSLGDPTAREFVRTHFAAPQLKSLERSAGTPGQAVGAAMLLLASGDFGQAVDVLSAVAGNTDDYWVKHYLALAQWRNNQREAAYLALNRLADERGSDFRPRHALGRLLMSDGRWVDAVRVLADASRFRDSTASVFADLGAAFLQIGKLREAIGALRAALTKDAGLAPALNNLGVCYLLHGDRARARKQFLHAIAIEPRCHAAIDNLVELYIADEDWSAAESMLAAYLEQNAQSEIALERLAWVKLATRSPAQARRLLERAVKSPNAVASTWNNLAIVYVDLAEYTAAEDAFRRAIGMAPNQVSIRTNYARVLTAHARHSAVLAALPPDIAMSSPESAALRANALAQHVPSDDGTLAFLRAAYERYSDHADIQVLLGYVLTAFAQQHDDAIGVLTKGLTRHPDHPGLANNLAYALMKRDRLPEARKILEPFTPLISSVSPAAVFIGATWGLLRIREGAFDEGCRYYQVARDAAFGRTRQRLEQKLAVEEARHLLAEGNSKQAERVAKLARSGVDAEFAEEARQLLLTGAGTLN
jgi:Flp pilus assembly protein TadD